MLKIRTNRRITKPFLKWAGGKGQLLTEIRQHLPQALKTADIQTYVEPFVGGGAVFFYLAQNNCAIQHFYLFDVNEDLVNCYVVIKEDVHNVIEELKELEELFLDLAVSKRKKLYLDIRERFNAEKSSGAKPAVAAMLIFLNRTCFNGLYRVNSKGFFNVPFGKYKNPQICNVENLKNVAEQLGRAKIACAHFTEAEDYVDDRTFVYLDPPYRPLSRTASFTSYTKDNFSEDDQIQLAEFCRRIDRKGAYFLLSNADPKNEIPNDDFFERHYGDYGFEIHTVRASRAINCKASGRGPINELLITNYKVKNEQRLLYPDTL